ncbi:hypothetical protein [Virgibacillus salexigens]|uniref:Uncharacterized protein n=1 Tax=Virgibacillus massiliensis TaxID=1462526 RepID=A0A024QID0_9BACI|nr:hypothetical protein [Virgibacillus massiliensis]CDQ41940.1 hypothetical protein BN990_04319 [Virgibacillus massiliensis]
MNINPEIDWNSEELKCVCGTIIDVSNIIDECSERLDTFNPISSLNKEVICSCGRSYNVDLRLKINIDVESSVSLTHDIQYYDKNDKVIMPGFFEELQCEDEVNLWDGEYIYDNKVYRVVDGKVFYILSAETDENQMNIFQLEEVPV